MRGRRRSFGMRVVLSLLLALAYGRFTITGASVVNSAGLA
jgi:hypothetical protein